MGDAGKDGSAAPIVSIVIVTWNAGDALLTCLRALAENPPSAPWEAIVIDNASEDGTIEAARRAAPWVRTIANSDNRGLAAANNQGIAATTGPLVLIANPDTVMRPGAIDELASVLERRPRAAMAVPRLCYPDGTLQVSAGDLPALSEALIGRQVQRRYQQVDRGFWWDGWAHNTERQIGRGHEACYLVRRAAIGEMGLQDERFVLDWEGIDWTARANALGWEVWFTPRAKVVHVGGMSVRQVPFRWIFHSHRGMYRYFAKHISPVLRPVLAAVVFLRGLLKALGVPFGLTDYDRSHRGR